MRLPALAVFFLLACKDDSSDDSGIADVDQDGDGALASVDCDDDNAAIFPSAPELCDAVDNDCDGLIDTNATDATTWYLDYDADGYSGGLYSLVQCEQPEGYVDATGDCDDTDAAIVPTATESCTDQIDNDCDVDTDCDDSGCQGDAVCAPTLVSVTPGFGLADDSTRVTLIGSGFGYKTAAPITVTVGGLPATEVVVVDDDTLTALFPGGPSGYADVVLQTGNGDATLSSGWIWSGAPIFLADGKAGAAGNLYFIDPLSGSTTTVGSLTTGVTGMAFDSSGVLYATASGSEGGLYTINTSTAVVTYIGPTQDKGGTTHNNIADITFVGSRLIGWSEDGDTPIEIDPSSGFVTIIGSSYGSAYDGMAYDTSTKTVYFHNYSGLHTLDPSTGAVTFIASYTGLTNSSTNAATMHLGTLYVTDGTSGLDGATTLGTMDPSTGTFTKVADLPANIDAIASPTP